VAIRAKYFLQVHPLVISEDLPILPWQKRENLSVFGLKNDQIEFLVNNLEFTIISQIAWEIFENQNKKCALTGLDLFISRLSKFNN
jgi:hypothetical protein